MPNELQELENRGRGLRVAGLETGDTAGLEACATVLLLARVAYSNSCICAPPGRRKASMDKFPPRSEIPALRRATSNN